MPLASSNKNHDIEVLRAVAIVFVVVHHLGFLFPWDGAWQLLFAVTTFWGGVDLFFCVSGFVIASSLLKEMQPGNGASFLEVAVPFWIKRVWRLWPAAMFWLLMAVVASKLFNASGAFGDFRANLEDGVAAIAQVANFHFLNCWFYKRGLCGNETIYWSLSLEEQFYFIFPFILFFLPRKWLAPTLIGVILLQCFRYRPMGTPLWVTRTDAICYGILIAMASGSSLKDKLYPYFLKARRTALGFSAVLIFLLAAIPTQQVVWFDAGLLAVLAAVLVFIASYDAKFVLPLPYCEGVLAWIGSRSYAIYLTHLFSFWLTHELFYRLYPGAQFNQSYTAQFVVVGFGLLVLLSELTYRFIETPLRDKGRRIAAHYRARGGRPPSEDKGAAPVPSPDSQSPVATVLPVAGNVTIAQ